MRRQHQSPNPAPRAPIAPFSAVEEQIIALLAQILVEDVQAESVTEGTLYHRTPCKPLKEQCEPR